MGPLIRALASAWIVCAATCAPLASAQTASELPTQSPVETWDPDPSGESRVDSTDGGTGPVDDELARVEFEAGVAAAERNDWQAAAQHFEASLAMAPRVASAFDLVIAYGHLDQPLALARAADRLVELADADRHRELLLEAHRLRDEALRRIATLELTLAPPAAAVRIDGNAAEGQGERRRFYLSPGTHSIAIDAEDHQRDVIELTADAGERVVLHASLERAPRVVVAPLEPVPSDAPAPAGPVAVAARDDTTRHVAAVSLWALGGASWATAVVIGSLAWVEGARLASADPMAAGFLSDAERYQDLATATVALSIVGGTLASAAAFFWPWEAVDEERGFWLAGVGAACIVAGVILLVRAPETLGDTRVVDGGRAIGTLLVSAGGPLALAPLSIWLEGVGEASARRPAGQTVGGGITLSGAF